MDTVPGGLDPQLMVALLRERMRRMEEVLSRLSEGRPSSPEDWEELVFAGAELTYAYRLVVRGHGGSGRQRILRYLQEHVGEVVEGEVLAAVAGISEWARRIRELDVELGYSISTHKTDPELGSSQYRLGSASPDPGRVRVWQLKSTLRKGRDLSPTERALMLVEVLGGDPVSEVDLREVVAPEKVSAVIAQLANEGWSIDPDHLTDTSQRRYVMKRSKEPADEGALKSR